MLKKFNTLRDSLDVWFAQSFDDEEFVYLDGVPFDDHQAVEAYPEYAWVYDKHRISQLLNQEFKNPVWNLALYDEPDEFPVMVKPRHNLDGMGKGAMKARSTYGIRAFLGKDYIAQPFMSGYHFSIDFLAFHGSILEDNNVMVATKKQGSITEWKSSPVCPAKAWEHAELLAKKLPDYAGAINIEMIDDYVLEVHLRPSVCWASIDGGLCGEHYYMALGEAPAPLEPYSPTFEVCGRLRKDIHMPRFLPTIPVEDYPGVRNVQWIGNPGEALSKQPQDSYSFKLFSVQGTDYNDCKAYASRLQMEIEKSLCTELPWLG